MAVNPSWAWSQLALVPEASPGVSGGPRYLAAWLPAFALERLGHRAQDRVAVVAEQRSALRIVACTPEARAVGVSAGMTVADARAQVEGLICLPWDDAAEAVDRAALVRSLARVCDRVRSEADEVVLFEIGAVTTLYGGEEAVVARVREQLEDFGHVSRVAVADHPRAAWALARSAPGDRPVQIVPPGDGASALGDRPIGSLGPSETLAEALRALGIRTVAPFAGLDPASIAGRFGAEGVWLHEAARGRPGPPWLSLPPARAVEPVPVPLASPVEDLAGLEPFLTRGLSRLQQGLRARGTRVADLELRLDLERGPAVRVPLRPARPTRDPGLLAGLLLERLGALRLAAPVLGLWLLPREEVVDEGLQPGLHDRRETGPAWEALCSRLRDVLGDTAVVRAVPQEAWLEEEAWIAVPIGDPLPPVGDGCEDDPVEAQEGAAWRAPRPRPSRLRPIPLPVDVTEDGRGRPCHLRVAGGVMAGLRHVRGPEVLEDGWWRPEGGGRREAWIAATPEGPVWLVKQRGRWGMAGLFD